MNLPLSQGHPVESKVQGAVLAGAITTILVWVASLFGLDVPSAIAAALTAVIAGLTAYLAPHTPRVYEYTDHKRD